MAWIFIRWTVVLVSISIRSFSDFHGNKGAREYEGRTWIKSEDVITGDEIRGRNTSKQKR